MKIEKGQNLLKSDAKEGVETTCAKSSKKDAKNASQRAPGGSPEAKIDSQGRFGRDLGFSKLLFFGPGAPLET